MPFSVAVAGASGYAGGELLRLLSSHPDFSVQTVTAHSNAGQHLLDVHPHLRSLAHLTLQPTEPDVLAGHDVVFLALPHGHSGALAAQLPDDTLVVDAGADHRLEDLADWDAFYGGEHHGSWTYGLPELPLAGADRQRSLLAGARRIAVPGCNVTAVTLGLAPGIAAGVIQPDDLVAVLAVGTSGAGRSLKANLLASEINGSAAPYAVGGVHRHIPEIRQNLRKAGAASVSLSFTPVLVPMSRGILSTATARLADGVTAADVRQAWSYYDDEPFVHVYPEGSYPKSADAVGANTALIGVGIDEAAGRVVTVTALDNLVKGTAGAAIQSANLALGLPETTGLPLDGVAP
ncbi:N-acetyl-gamma-glutamyl-phosphate reductase [Desertivibrio insolitus]|uniref:N-acetyl-gamma-glutamyl-phosphate reductase n=1 Tax=Herbiconiux sp. SYSU D00978 TaxID=2812562 RepID=UPI001A95B815|nr:N-acetyl-gamma-glutamyl-phosphate reductase [Herbiconiux sp. SYSU D00978]